MFASSQTNSLTVHANPDILKQLSITQIGAADPYSYSVSTLNELIRSEDAIEDHKKDLKSKQDEKSKESIDKQQQLFMRSYLGIHQQRPLQDHYVQKDFERTNGASIIIDGESRKYSSSSFESFKEGLQTAPLDQNISNYIKLFAHQSGFLFDGQNYLLKLVQDQIYEATTKTENNPQKWVQAGVYYGQKIDLNYMERDPYSTRYEISSSDPSACIVKTTLHTDHLRMKYAISPKESVPLNIPCNFSIETEHELRSDGEKVTKNLKDIKITFANSLDKEIFEKYFGQVQNLTELRKNDTELKEHNLIVMGDPDIMLNQLSTSAPINMEIFNKADENDNSVISKFNADIREHLDERLEKETSDKPSLDEEGFKMGLLDTFQRAATNSDIEGDFIRGRGSVIVCQGEQFDFNNDTLENTSPEENFHSFKDKLTGLSSQGLLENGIVDYINTFAHQGGFLYDSRTYLLRLSAQQVMSANPQTSDDWKKALKLRNLKSNAKLSRLLPTYIIDDKNNCRVKSTANADYLIIATSDGQKEIPCHFSIETEHALKFDEASKTVNKTLNSLKIKFNTTEDKKTFEKFYGKVNSLDELEKLNNEFINGSKLEANTQEKQKINILAMVIRFITYPFYFIYQAIKNRNIVVPSPVDNHYARTPYTSLPVKEASNATASSDLEIEPSSKTKKSLLDQFFRKSQKQSNNPKLGG